MSRKREEMTSDLNTRILDAITTAIENRVLHYRASKMLLEAKIQLETQIWTFGQMDRMRVILVKYILRGTFGQMDCIEKMLAKWLRMLRKTSPD